MQSVDIPDRDIPTADSAEVIRQYKGWVYRIAKRYASFLENTGAFDMEDLIQAGNIGLLEAQKTYNPERGKNFIGWSFFYIRNAMYNQLGFNDRLRHCPPAPLIYLDAPIAEDEETTLLDTIEDPTVIPFDEPICEEETRREIVEEVRAAVDRLKGPKQREAIKRVWLDGQERKEAAEEMGTSITALHALDEDGRRNLRRDNRLKLLAMPSFAVGVHKFRSTWTSAVEAAVIWLEEHQATLMESVGGQDPDDVQTSIYSEYH